MNQITEYSDIFDFIKRQETAYKKGIPLNDAWTWSMYDHIKTSFLYTNSQLLRGKTEFTPIKNITRPILNLQHRTEDIEVKDVQVYVDDPEKYHLSFLVKKYHDDVFVKENDMDTFFDELNVSRIDFGGGLSKRLGAPAPEVVPLQSIAFCDQSDMLSGPIGIKHFYSPDQLLGMSRVGWGNKENGATIELKDLVILSREEKKDDQEGQVKKTPGKYIEVYEVHGTLPKQFANKEDRAGEYEPQIFIVAFYQKKDDPGNQSGVILYTAPEKKSPFKLIKRDPVYGRALGFGGAEELFEPQVWVNYDMIRMQDMLDAAAKTILITSDSTLAAKHPTGLKEMENLEFLEEDKDSNTRQLDTFPRNLRLFENSVAQWEAHAQQMGAANDSIMGQSPAAGTPFKLQELVTDESRGLHEYRRGQYAKHLEEIYNDWIIPHIQKKITEGTRFLSELSLDELRFVTDSVVTCRVNYYIKNQVLKGAEPTQNEVDFYKEQVRDGFRKKGNKHFIEILRGEFRAVPLRAKVSIAGKSKNLAVAVDKIVNIFRFAFSNPQGFAQVMQIPGMAKAFNQILEFSGLSPADFSGIEKMALPTPTPTELPIEEMTQNA